MIVAVVGDLASAVTDAVVRPADAMLAPAVPALQRLDAAAGPSFARHIRTTTILAPGAAVVTSAGDLPAELVVHAVIGQTAETATAEALRRAIEAALWQCVQWRIGSLAVPGLGTGAGPVSPGDARQAIAAALEGPLRNPDYPATILIVTDADAERERWQARLGPGDDR